MAFRLSDSLARGLALAALLVGAPASAQETPVRLSVKPILCIIDKFQTNCRMAFVVRWRSERADYFCLYSDLSTLPLQCWDDHESGMHAEERVIAAPFSFWMHGTDPAVRLAEVRVEVLTEPDDRRRSRRRRHVWSVL